MNFTIRELTNLDSVTVNRNPISDNELSTKKQFDDSIGEMVHCLDLIKQ